MGICKVDGIWVYVHVRLMGICKVYGYMGTLRMYTFVFAMMNV